MLYGGNDVYSNEFILLNRSSNPIQNGLYCSRLVIIYLLCKRSLLAPYGGYVYYIGSIIYLSRLTEDYLMLYLFLDLIVLQLILAHQIFRVYLLSDDLLHHSQFL